MANQSKEETFGFDSCVRGYHVTEKQWKDIAFGEGLTRRKSTSFPERERGRSKRDPGNKVESKNNNKNDSCAMAVYRQL